MNGGGIAVSLLFQGFEHGLAEAQIPERYNAFTHSIFLFVYMFKSYLFYQFFLRFATNFEGFVKNRKTSGSQYGQRGGFVLVLS